VSAVAPVLVIQGGAGKRRLLAGRQAIGAALARISRACWPALEQGGSALEAVVEAVIQLEADPLFNAGLGSKLQADGAARMSASLMDGDTERFSGVVNIEGIAHPIRLCHHLLDGGDRVLAGSGALSRARELGLAERDVRTRKSIAAWQKAIAGETGTVGAVALDAAGRLAAATSTGGRGMERIGRVSDSCTVAGNFATESAAVSCTGVGEDIVDAALAVRVIGGVDAGQSLDRAVAATRARMVARDWRAGLIAVDATGAWTVAHTTEELYWHAIDLDGRTHRFPENSQTP
jgi:L-asparaginase